MKDLALKVWTWIVWSSENQNKISSTLTNGIPFVILLAGFMNITVDQVDLSNGINALLVLISAAVMGGTGVRTLWFLGRKITNTALGSNVALKGLK